LKKKARGRRRGPAEDDESALKNDASGLKNARRVEDAAVTLKKKARGRRRGLAEEDEGVLKKDAVR